MGKCSYDDGTGICGSNTVPLSQYCSLHQPFSAKESTMDPPQRRGPGGWAYDSEEDTEGNDEADG